MKYRFRWVAMTIFFLLGVAAPVLAQEVTVIGSNEDALALFQQDPWWTEMTRGHQLKVPHRLIVAISDRWQTHASNLPVQTKKDIFFSALLPLVVHANSMVLERRSRLEKADAKLARGKTLTADEASALRDMAVLLRITNREKASAINSSDELRKVIKEGLYKLDVIPAGLVLGQAAYESGYATSRFAIQGNALFGQWSFGGEGLLPEQQRKHLGDHRIASFKWPFDSVRSYFINLSSHPAYEAFRRIRAERKAAGKPLDSLSLAQGLKSYSERGQAYVDTLKGIIKANNLDIADNAVFRDEPMRFIFTADDQAAAEKMRKDIEAMRKSGQLETIINQMKLE